MSRVKELAISVLAVAIALPVTAYPQVPSPDTSVFSATPWMAEFAISNDGTMLAWAQRGEDGSQNLMIREIGSDQVRTIASQGRQIAGLDFKTNTRIIGSFIDQNRRQNYGITYAIDISEGETTNRSRLGRFVELTGFPLALLPDSPDQILTDSFFAYDETLDNYTLVTPTIRRDSLSEHNSVKVDDAVDLAFNYVASPDGRLLAAARYDYNRDRASIVIRNADGSWREVFAQENDKLRQLSLLGLRGSNRVVFAARDTENNFGALQAVNLTTGAITTLVRGDGVEVVGTVVDPWTHQIVAIQFGGLAPGYQWLDASLGEAVAEVEAQWPDKQVRPLDWSTDRDRIIMSVSAPDDPPSYYLFHKTAGRLELLGHAYPELEDRPLGRQTATTFKARDGRDVPVYVTYPAGVENPRNAPVIIMPHGGPEARDHPDYDWWLQFLATRGYLVVQPQFRGSTGFGLEWADAGRQQWGQAMQHDVTDALGWAVTEGLADPQRACIIGASYGGYAALIGATMTPELYRCVVSFAGVSDLPEIMRDERLNWGSQSTSYAYWKDHIGDDRAAWRQFSPVNHVDAVRAPILLIHGDRDDTVDIAQSQRMARALDRAGKAHRFVELQNETHHFSRQNTRQQFLESLDVFLAEHLGPGAR